MIKENYECDGQMDIFAFLDHKKDKTKQADKYPNCSQDEIDYILPILRVDVYQNMREQIYKEWESGMSYDNLCKCIKYYYKAWDRDHEHRFNFSEDMRYHSAITYPAGMELRRKFEDSTGCCVNTWAMF